MTLEFIIIDDDATARMILQRYSQKTTGLVCKGVFENAELALDFMNNQTIDLIFLDIEMPGYSGIDFLNLLPALPSIVFTTSKSQYAYEAFQFEAVDYLKKPFNFPRFQKAIDKVKGINRKENIIEKQDLQTDIYIKDNGRLTKVNLLEVLYFESDMDYVHINTKEQIYTINCALKTLEKKLPSHSFTKVHRSFIVNLKAIVDIEDNSLVINRKVIPISRRNKNELLNKLNII